MLPAQVTPQTGAYLDWLFMMVKEHCICLFEDKVAQSFSRMRVSVPMISSGSVLSVTGV